MIRISWENILREVGRTSFQLSGIILLVLSIHEYTWKYAWVAAGLGGMLFHFGRPKFVHETEVDEQ